MGWFRRKNDRLSRTSAPIEPSIESPPRLNPEFPLRVMFFQHGVLAEEELIESSSVLACQWEDLDTDQLQDDEVVVAVDARGRRVQVLTDMTELLVLRLYPDQDGL